MTVEKRHSNITPDLIARARELVPEYKPGASIIGGVGSRCVCGLGLLLIAAGENPWKHGTHSAMVRFEIFGPGLTHEDTEEVDDAENYSIIWEKFDDAVLKCGGAWLAAEQDAKIFNDWLDWVSETYVAA